MHTGNTLHFRHLTILLLALVASGCLSDSKPGGSGNDAAVGSSAPGSNSAPTISGSPNTAVLVGDAYSFTPSARDADGDNLTFSSVNKPRWATFSSTTGQLSGQVSLGDIGVYQNIQISVSDGTATTSLANFAVTVTDSALGSMTLSWRAPTENTDGTQLMDLGGYNIYFGQSRGSYPNRIRIDNPSIDTYVVENLVPDTYYVVATSFNSAGTESPYSNVAVKIVD